jgi:hypothetical protein
MTWTPSVETVAVAYRPDQRVTLMSRSTKPDVPTVRSSLGYDENEPLAPLLLKPGQLER